jgi:predicted nucleic acid-binding Zn ribbon protein
MIITTLLTLLADFVSATPATDACVQRKAAYANLTFYPGTGYYKNDTRTRKRANFSRWQVC